MTGALRATHEVVNDYVRLFVNRRAYTLQSMRPHPASGSHYYFRPSDRKTGAALSLMEETSGSIWRAKSRSACMR
jgi:hypothetical protein